MKQALVVEGGAMRGIFAAGVLDRFLEEGFNPFDVVVGVSAGAVNAAAYLAEQHGRNKEMFTNYSLDPQYISWRKFLKGSHLLDLDWLWEITTDKLPIDTDILFDKNIDFEIGVTLNENGNSKFIKVTPNNISHVMKASCTVPFFYRNFLAIDQQIVSDGGVASPIPVDRAIDLGADKIMVIRSRKKNFRMEKNLETKFSKLLFRKYPGLSKAIQNRSSVYNTAIDLIQTPPKHLQILDVCPPDYFKTKRFTKDYQTLMDDYEVGRLMGEWAMKNWK